MPTAVVWLGVIRGRAAVHPSEAEVAHREVMEEMGLVGETDAAVFLVVLEVDFPVEEEAAGADLEEAVAGLLEVVAAPPRPLSLGLTGVDALLSASICGAGATAGGWT